MNAYWYCLASKLIAVGGFAVLVIFDHPWLGLLCLIAAMASMDSELKA